MRRIKNRSEAISGFANTEGGLLVLGIDCRRISMTRIDAAESLSLVRDVFLLK